MMYYEAPPPDRSVALPVADLKAFKMSSTVRFVLALPAARSGSIPRSRSRSR